MDIQIASLCDFAADYQGKLCIQGTFDSLYAKQLPVQHPHCALALRICFTDEDAGKHKLHITIVDEDGSPLDAERMPIEAEFQVQLPPNESFLTRNLILNLQGLKFAKEGNHSVDISIDDELHSRIPLRIVKMDPQQAAQQGQPGAGGTPQAN